MRAGFEVQAFEAFVADIDLHQIAPCGDQPALRRQPAGDEPSAVEGPLVAVSAKLWSGDDQRDI